MLHDDATVIEMPVEFGIQFIVAETDGRRFGAAVGEDDALDMRPISGGQAHRARFAGGVQRAATQMKVAALGTCGANGANLGVGSGVVAGDDAVPTFGDDPAIAHDDGTERAAFAGFATPGRQFDGAGEEIIVVMHCLRTP